MRALAFCLVVVPLVVLAGDVRFRQGNTLIGPVSELSCRNDGGLLCTRDAGTAVGAIVCNGATATEPGCITPSAQTLAGDKTWSGYQRIIGVAHASLTACSAGLKNMLQGCTTHGAPVWCDGTNNQELLGASSDEVVLAAYAVNGIPAAFFGAVTLPSSSAWTLNAITGFWNAGSGSSSTLRLSFVGTAGTCNCDVDCDAPLARTACSGTCTWSAGDTVYFFRGTSGTAACLVDPGVGTLQLMGVAQ